MYPLLEVFSWQIPTYFLVQSLTAVVALVWIRARAQAQGFPAPAALDTAMFVIVFGWIGARVLHILWEAPSYYLTQPRLMLDLTSGGFVYYGGLWAGLFVGWLLLRREPEKPLGEWLDFFAPVAAFGTAFGRWGCALAGCCFGKSCDLPWALSGRHPVPVYLFLWDFAAMGVLLFLERRRPAGLRTPGSLLALWLVVHGTGRFFSEFLRDDDRGPSLGLSLSQWLALVLVAGGLRFILRRDDSTAAN